MTDDFPVTSRAARAPASAVSLALTIVTFLFTLLLTGAAAVILAAVVPAFEKMFCDFRVELPDSTKALINFSRSCNIYYAVATALGASAMVGWLSHVVARRYNDRLVQVAWTLFVLAGELFIAALTVILLAYCLAAPMVALTGAVSGSGK
ncbi:MAG: hypothetical protein ACHRHE_19190 [Tepidisphaerales bacterium]